MNKKSLLLTILIIFTPNMYSFNPLAAIFYGGLTSLFANWTINNTRQIKNGITKSTKNINYKGLKTIPKYPLEILTGKGAKETASGCIFGAICGTFVFLCGKETFFSLFSDFIKKKSNKATQGTGA
ncbi:hypothetical protein KAH94_06620 [bacterium]|nr:hypothetical protein [bacterium]